MAGTSKELVHQLEAYALLWARQQEELLEQKQTIESLHAMITQLRESAKEKKCSRQGKRKRVLTPIESSDEEMNAIHMELSSKHCDPLDSEKCGSQRINKLERHLDTV